MDDQPSRESLVLTAVICIAVLTAFGLTGAVLRLSGAL